MLIAWNVRSSRKGRRNFKTFRIYFRNFTVPLEGRGLVVQFVIKVSKAISQLNV